MTPEQLRAALDRLGLTMADAARRWGVPYRTLQNWCKDAPDDDEPSNARRPSPLLDHLVALETGKVRPLKPGDE